MPWPPRPPTAALVAACAVLVACGGGVPPPERVEIELAGLASGRVDGRAGPLPVDGDGGARRLVAAAGSTIDLFLRVPREAELRFALVPAVPAAEFAVAVRDAAGEHALAPVAGADGRWQASLARFAGAPVRLRLENRSPRALAWVQAHVAGVERPLPPVLPAAVRPPGRLDVLVYVADAMRADHLSLYGYARPTTPVLERLAAHAVVFESAYATGPSTPNTIPSLFASRYPSELGPALRADGAARITLAEAFRAAGYCTAAFTANPLLLPGLGYARGFDHYEQVPYRTVDGRSHHPPAADVHARVLAWLETRPAGPCFLYVHVMDTHDYSPPPPFRGRFAGTRAAHREVRAPREKTAEIRQFAAERFAPLPGVLEQIDPDRYDETIVYVDHELGALHAALAARGLAERTALVVTADHGEALGPEDDGTYLHSHSVFEELVRVPLVMVLPWLDGTARPREPVSLLDLGPTLLDLAGVAVPAEFAGRSLLAPRGELAPSAAVGERLEPPWKQGPVQRAGQSTVADWFVREGDWKLVLDRERAWLFHLPTDPKETRDVSAERPDVAGYLTSVAWRTSPALGPEAGASPAVGVDAAERRQLNDALRALGYVQ